jgi:hypothetical protein
MRSVFSSGIIRGSFLIILIFSGSYLGCSDDPAGPARVETIDSFFAVLTQSELDGLATGGTQLPAGGQVVMMPIRNDLPTAPPDSVAILFWPEPGTLGKTYEVKRFLEFDTQGSAICPSAGTTCLLTITLPDGANGPLVPEQTIEEPSFYAASITPSELAAIQEGATPLPPGGQIVLVPRRTDSTAPPAQLPFLFWPEPGTLGKTYEVKRLLELDQQGKAQCPNDGETCGLVITQGPDPGD